jgi:hypothetical protein
VNYKTLDEAFYPVGKGFEVFDVKTAPCIDRKRTCALAAARLRKAPYEMLLLELKKKNGAWKIVKTWPYIDH